MRMSLLFLVLFVLVSKNLLGQVLPDIKELPELKCLHTDAGNDSLQFPGTHERFDSLYAQLDSFYNNGTGVLNVMHIGGSHVQAGHFTHRMSSNLSSFGRMKSVGQGLLFPFKALKTNAPSSYVLECVGKWTGSRCVQRNSELPLGISGAYALTSDTAAALVLSLDPISAAPLQRLRILGEGSDSCVHPVLFCAGDTIYPLPYDGKPGFCFSLPQQTDSCAIFFRGLKQDSLHFAVRGILPESGENGFNYLSLGINGASVPSWLNCTLFEEELSLMPPHLVFLGIGINDANVFPREFDKERFKANYRMLMQRILSVNPLCCFVFITNNDCWFSVRGLRRQYNTNTPKVQQAMHELAQEFGGAVFDAFRLMGGMRSSAAWVRAGLQRSDHIHFTKKGYELWGDLLYNALMKDYIKVRNTKTHSIEESVMEDTSVRALPEDAGQEELSYIP